ncbi:MAG: hypothetical protein EPO68_10895 [Planctomycetota bacterium]|nr:MAG: hypothetical protein EPO68_10895 [Planctomycetota bacterium]
MRRRGALASARGVRKSFRVSSAARSIRPPGQVATPVGLARRVAAALLDAAPQSRSFFDPACGSGALLAALAAEWAARGRAEALCLHGCDVDASVLVDARLAVRAAGAGARVELRLAHADALAPSTPWPAGAAIAANPPWASYSGRQRVQPARTSALGGWPSLHGEFIERIAAHCAAHEVPAVVLLPAAWCELVRYAPSRARVDAHAALARTVEQLGERAFPGVVGSTALVRLLPCARDAARVAPDELELSSALRCALESMPPWPAQCFGDTGVHTGNAVRELVDRAPLAADLREGRDLAAFRLAAPRLALRAGVERNARLRFRVGSPSNVASARVLLRQTADRPIAAVHEPASWFRNSLLACRPPADLDPDCAAALLNGPVAAVFHRLSFADARQRAFPQVKIGHLRAQRFPLGSRADGPELHDELARRARALRDPSRALDAAWEHERAALAGLALAAYRLPESLAHAVRRALAESRGG